MFFSGKIGRVVVQGSGVVSFLWVVPLVAVVLVVSVVPVAALYGGRLPVCVGPILWTVFPFGVEVLQWVVPVVRTVLFLSTTVWSVPVVPLLRVKCRFSLGPFLNAGRILVVVPFLTVGRIFRLVLLNGGWSSESISLLKARPTLRVMSVHSLGLTLREVPLLTVG